MFKQHLCLAGLCCALSLTPWVASAESEASVSVLAPLTLTHVIDRVQANDYTLARKELESSAFSEEAEASNDWPDPVLSAGVQNLPTDTFAFTQEPMTNLRLGIRQMLPQGDSLEIRQNMAQIGRSMQGVEQVMRRLQLKRDAQLAWFEAWYWQKNLALIEEDRVFVRQVMDFVRSMYQVGMRNQSDLIGVEFDLLQLDERQIDAGRKFRAYRSELNTLANEMLAGEGLTAELPELTLNLQAPIDTEALLARLRVHPALQMQERKIQMSGQQVAMAEQAFEPSWGVELSYGLRNGDEMDGSDRADFFSAGVSVQWPFFSSAKQTHQLSAARHRQAAEQNARDEALQKLRYQFLNLHRQFLDTATHRVLYEHDILPTLAAQKNTALNSYQADKGDFRLVSELLRKEQNARIQHQRLRVDEQKLLAQLNFWLVDTSEQGARSE